MLCLYMLYRKYLIFVDRNCNNEVSIYTFMQVIWNRFFKKSSAMDKGTLHQMKVAIKRSSVPNDPADNMKAAEDFLLVVLRAHIMAASETILSCANIDSISALADSILASYVNLQLGSTASSCSDGVFVYACDVLSMGLLWMGFHDAIREGDGDRMMTYWKFLLPIFKVSGRRNYTIEALNIQLQRHFLLSERKLHNLCGHGSLIPVGVMGVTFHAIYILIT